MKQLTISEHLLRNFSLNTLIDHHKKHHKEEEEQKQIIAQLISACEATIDYLTYIMPEDHTTDDEPIETKALRASTEKVKEILNLKSTI